jgi:predicted amidohydrolase YtcJ
MFIVVRTAFRIFMVLGLAAGSFNVAFAQNSPTHYFGGTILTMSDDRPEYVESLVSHAGKIVYVGKQADAKKQFPKATRIDLQDKFLMPSFRDPHGHFSFAIRMMDQVNVAVPPVGTATDIASIVEQLHAFKKKRGLDDEAILVAWGYDQDGLTEKRHLTKHDLDADFPTNPVILIHVSGHGAVFNSRALEVAGITAETQTPAGGVIARLPGGNEPAGLLMETAWIPLIALLPVASEEHRLSVIGEAQAEYARNGYTSAIDGFATTEDVKFLQKAAAQGKLYIDIAALMGFVEMDHWLDNSEFPFEKKYSNNFRIAGMKITQDGSPQGKTAYMREPYLTGGPAGQKDWRGAPISSKSSFEQLVKTALDKNLPLQVHCNGDAAIDMLIDAARKAGVTAEDDKRIVVVHSNIQAMDQLDSYVELGLTPTYFSNHAYFWGDVHTMNFGKERASHISPMKTAKEKGLIFSNHTDFNITPLDPFFTVWTAMKRESRSGVIIGPQERIDAYTALQALTTGPAWQFFEESRVGKLDVGMESSFVITDKNPLKMTEVDDIRTIKILETIKEGETIYSSL